jgi:hypothetical protein
MADDDSDDTSGLVGLVLGGGRAYLTGSTARDAFEAIDVGALLDGDPIEEAIERERAGKLLGRLLGRALADELADGSRVQEFAVRIAGQRVGAQVGQAVVVGLLEYGLLAAAIDEFRGMTTDDALLGLLDEVEAVVAPEETTDAPEDLDTPRSSADEEAGPIDFDTDDRPDDDSADGGSAGGGPVDSGSIDGGPAEDGSADDDLGFDDRS